MSINQSIKFIIDTLEQGVNSRFAKRIGTAPTVVGTFTRRSQRGSCLFICPRSNCPEPTATR